MAVLTGNILEMVCIVLREELCVTADSIITAATTRDDLGMDSLDDVLVIIALESAFDVAIYDEEAEKIVTVADAADVVSEAIARRRGND